MKSFKNFLYVPTNRACGDAIGQLVDEATWVRQRQSPPVVCVIENNIEAQISDSHGAILKQKATDAGIASLHLTEDRAGQFVEAVVQTGSFDETERNRLRMLLLPGGTSYGRGPNLAALLGESLRSELIHRRDSDIRLDPNNPNSPPIELEVEVAGRPVVDVQSKINKLTDVALAPDAKVRVVGTSSYGSPTFDRRDLFDAGMDHLVAFQMLGRKGEFLSEVRAEVEHYFVEELQTRYAQDFLEVDIDNRVEMEAYCSSEVHRKLPEMPTDILGCDYMGKDLVWRCHDGLVFHSRKVEHRYTSSRAEHKNTESDIAYAIRDIQYIQMGRIWQQHNKQMDSFWETNRGLDAFDPNVYTESFRGASALSGEALIEVRLGAETVYRDAARQLGGAGSVRLQAVATRVEELGQAMDTHVQDAVRDFCDLVEHWARLVAAAAEVDVDSSWIAEA